MKGELTPARELGEGRWIRRALPVLGAAAVAALGIEGGRLALARWRTHAAIQAVFAEALAAPRRPLSARLSHPLGAGHRPAGGGCTASAPRADHARLAAFERAGDGQGLATVHALACDWSRARRTLLELSPSRPQQSDLAALLVDDPDARDSALRMLDEILREEPKHPQALFNRGLVLAALGLPRAAARSFDAVAALGEVGWAEEARGRADELRAGIARRATAKAALDRELAGLRQGEVPPAATLERYPEHVRIAFHQALQEASEDRKRKALALAAGALDRTLGGQVFANMTRGSVDLQRMAALTQNPTVAMAEEYQRLAVRSGDPLHHLRGEQLLARALAAAAERERAAAIHERILIACGQVRLPALCADTKVWLANVYIELYRPQRARELLLAARREVALELTDGRHAAAERGLARLATFRSQLGLAHAYAEELSLHEDCLAALGGRSALAELRNLRGDRAGALAELQAAKACSGGKRPSLEPFALNVLANLVRGERQRTPLSDWFDESHAVQAALPDAQAAARGALLDLAEGRSRIARDPEQARLRLERSIARIEDVRDAATERGRMQAYGSLVTAASGRGDHGAAFALLAAALRVPMPQRCALGLAGDSGWYALVFRSADGVTGGIHERPASLGRASETRVFPADTSKSEIAIPTAVVEALQACPQVEVLATPSFFGRPRLLPAHVAWSYRLATHVLPARKDAGTTVRLLVHDVAIPSRFGLPRLGTQRAEPIADERVVSLAGGEATPAAVMSGLSTADIVEIHAHGLLDPEISDAPALVLAPDDRGRALLDARAIETLQLPRRPAVVLGACDVGRSARYWSYAHGLPSAFLRAGARSVIASPAPVEDISARPFFEAVWRRVREGAPFPTALRDERRSPRWQNESDDWTRDVVVFQ